MSEELNITVYGPMDPEQMITVQQLPIITEQLEAVRTSILARVEEAQTLAATPDTVKSIKAYRAEMRKEFEALDTLRKQAKNAVMAPYNTFEQRFKDIVTVPYNQADKALADQIYAIEKATKAACEAKCKEYFSECCRELGVQIVSYDRVGVKIGMAEASQKTQPPKKISEQIRAFVERVARDMDTIRKGEFAGEIMDEYQRVLDLGRAIGVVKDRHARIEAQKADAERRAEMARQEAERERRIVESAPTPVAPPVPVVDDPEIELTFKVTCTLSMAKALKQFLISGGYQYE